MSTSASFKTFIENTSVKRSEQQQVLTGLPKDQFHQLTWNFLNTLIENKRLSHLEKIISKYFDYYKILTKEENVTIISAKELNEAEKYLLMKKILSCRSPEKEKSKQYLHSHLSG